MKSYKKYQFTGRVWEREEILNKNEKTECDEVTETRKISYDFTGLLLVMQLALGQRIQTAKSVCLNQDMHMMFTKKTLKNNNFLEFDTCTHTYSKTKPRSMMLLRGLLQINPYILNENWKDYTYKKLFYSCVLCKKRYFQAEFTIFIHQTNLAHSPTASFQFMTFFLKHFI